MSTAIEEDTNEVCFYSSQLNKFLWSFTSFVFFSFSTAGRGRYVEPQNI